MADDGLDEPFSQCLFAVRFKNEEITNPTEGGVVGHHTREADLVFTFVNTKAKRSFDRTGDNFQRSTERPIGSIRQKIKDDLQIQTAFIRADDKLLTTNFENLHWALQFAASGLCGQWNDWTSAGGETRTGAADSNLRPNQP